MKDAKKKGSKDNSMSIKTCYVIGIQCQLDAKENKKTNTLDVSGRHKVFYVFYEKILARNKP